jgi:DNA-binding beta-propeller fold protein YncE
MAAQSITTPDAKGSGAGRIFTWLIGIVSFGLLAYLLAQVAYQIAVPPPAHRLLFVQDIPLPSGLGAASPGQTNPLTPGVQQQFDAFDFQAYDAATHRLFIAHTGPNPDLLTLAHMKFDPKYDGHIVVFDTSLDKVIARINIPQVAGIVDAPDLGRVYAANAQDNIIDAIDVHTLKFTSIQLDDNESPDAMSYDPVDHEIFVSDPGAPADPNKTMNADPNNENVTVISTVTNKVITKINLGNLPLAPGEKAPLSAHRLPLYGHDVGHNKYDPGLHRVFVTSQILPNGDDPNPYILPPPGTGEFFSIDPVQHKILQELVLPASCSTPHGMTIDSTQEIAFVACTDFDSSRNLVSNLLRVNLRTMTVIAADPPQERLAAAPDIVLLDTKFDVLFIACKGGISIFDAKAGEFHKLGDYLLGKGTHTIAIDEQTQYIYLPQFAGGRPILRIGRYNPRGV